MAVLDRFLKSINTLNILLMAAIGVLAVYLIGPSAPVNKRISSPLLSHAPVRQASLKPETEKTDKDVNPSMSDFIVVAEKNLFHVERRVPPEKTGEAALPKPEIVLFGTMVDDDMSLAFVEDKKSPKTTPGRGKRQTTLKKGDMISGFQLTGVENDRIVLTRGEESMTVHLMDAEKRKDGAAPPSGASVRNPSGRVPQPATQALPPPIPRQPPSGTTGTKGQLMNVLSTRGGG